MADREKVIEELERLSEWFFLQYQVVYDGDAPDYYDAYKTVDDALALLKEQEAVEPIKMQRMDNNFSFFVPYFLCGNCRYELVGEDVMFCAHCGRKVKWDDR